MSRSVGQMREALMESIEKVRRGQMDPASATAIAKLAGQISLSLQVEANMRRDGLIGKDVQHGAMQLSGPQSAEASGVTVHRISDEEPRRTLPGSSVFEMGRTA